MAQDHGGRPAGAVLVVGKHAAHDRCHLEGRERVGGHALDFHSYRLVADQKGARTVAGRLIRADVVEHRLLRPPVVKILVRHAAWVRGRERQIRAGFADPDHTIGVGIRQRPQQDGVDDAEQRGVRADADGEQKDRDGRKTGTPTNPAKRIAQILGDGIDGRQTALVPVALLC